MSKNNAQQFFKGCRDGVPIMLGYLAVSFSFGIKALLEHLTVGQAVLMSGLNLTSAGQFASLSVIAAAGSYLELALSQLIINLRYCLMSASLSQKVDPKAPFFHRFIMSFGVTDEIFALSAAAEGPLSPFYTYGQMAVAIPGWTIGTLLGAIAGNILPARVLVALSVALYCMFIAIIVPPAKQNKTLAWVIVVSMAVSAVFCYTPYLKEISAGMRVILLTVALSVAAALIRPVKEEDAA